ncbi:MAG: aminotransferase class V-fold PLP-dependent enzyme [Anaerolineae bacterium]|nr:aminotransferase class V-fold PLP-dependent enzyme [Anaerolineae bacterium]
MSNTHFHVTDADVHRTKSFVESGKAQYEAAYAGFLSRYSHGKYWDELEALRKSDYQRLDELGQIYLDYTGGGLYGRLQVEQHMKMLLSGVYGNPHSSNPTSLASTALDESARNRVLSFFNADPEEYMVVFTSNASGALRIIGESYPFDDNGQYLLIFDNHNSVNGIREFAHRAGAPVTYSPVIPPDLRISEDALYENLAKALPGGNNLFAYPAQSNFSGVQHPLDWVEIAQSQGWDVLLDCAAFTPTNRLDLREVRPDFISISFYKIFGYPTGVGALIARREKMAKLHKPWFAGGTITVASVQADSYYLEDGVAAFEDGTIDYLNLPAVEIGLKHLEEIGIDRIHDRVASLTAYLLDELTTLRHENGNTLVKIYGPITMEARGGTISFNLFDPNQVIFDYKLVEGLASAVNISLRTGCFCNPGAGELALNIQQKELVDCFSDHNRMTFEQFAMAVTALADPESVGAVRISVGLVTNFHDVHTLVQFLKSFLNVQSEGFIWTEAQA